jgi:hypothetical protein
VRETRPRSSWAERSPSFFFRVLEKRPLRVCGCHPVAATTSATETPPRPPQQRDDHGLL